MEKISSIREKYSGKLDAFDLDFLLGFAIEKSREFVLTHPEYTLSPKEYDKIHKFLEERIEGRPLAYITGHKEFYGLDFLVTEDTLIPRPETEILVEEVLEYLRENLRDLSTRGLGRDDKVVEIVSRDDKVIETVGRDDKVVEAIGRDDMRVSPVSQDSQYITLLDIGTGSGCIPIALARHFSFNRIIATDISSTALRVAKKNATRLLSSQKEIIEFLTSDLLGNIFSRIQTLPKTSTLVITANLPYVPEEYYQEAYKNSDTKGILFEPKTALTSENYGLSHIEKLLTEYKENEKFFPKNTLFFLEFLGDDKQVHLLKEKIPHILPSHTATFHNDLAGIPRIIRLANT